MLTLQGLLLFAFIPLVLFLLLRQPLGPVVSVMAGLVIMFGHRFLARPWMARHATARCLWCGRGVQEGEPVTIHAGRRGWPLAACGPAHRALIARFLTFVTRARGPIAIGIFVPLAVLVGGSLVAAAGRPVLAPEWNRWQFQMAVSVTVVGVSLAYRTVERPDETLACPFPLHNFFLLGICTTLWIFRVVGAWWLIGGALALARAFGGA